MASHHELIHAKLLQLARDGAFRAVSFDDQGVPSVASEPTPPSSAEVGEVQCSFNQDNVRTRRDYRVDRDIWTWEVLLGFPSRVSAEDFEEAISSSPPVVAPVPEDGLRQVTLELTQANYEHPPRTSPRNGSKIRYEFRARLAPG